MPEHNIRYNLPGRIPAAFGFDLEIPLVVRRLAGDFQCVFHIRRVALRDANALTGDSVLFPDPEVIRCLLQLIQLQLIHEFLPVDNQQRESSELLAAACVGGVNRVEQQCACAALNQLKRSRNRIFATLHGLACTCTSL